MASQVEATIIKTDGNPAFPTPISMSFPTDEIKMAEVVSGTINSSIQWKDTLYYASETFDALVSAANEGGGSSYLVKTYAEIVALIAADGLVAGTQYEISDFATKHYIVDAGGTQYLGTIITGTTEPLIVTAVDVDKLDKLAKSTLYPQDIIYVDFDEDNWLYDLSFSDLTDDQNPVIVSGWKGTIYYRHDTLLDNYMGYDFRNVKFRRWKTDVDNWSNAVTYAKGDFAISDTHIYRSISNGNINNTPINGSDFWQELNDLVKTEYWNNEPTTTNGIPSNSLEFSDFKTFAEGAGSATYNQSCRSNHFEPFKDDYNDWELTGTILSNNVFFLQDSSFYNVYSNEIGSEFAFNTFGGDFIYCSAGSYMQNNMIGDNFNEMVIGHYFYENIFSNSQSANVIGNEFFRNKVSRDMDRCTWGNRCNNNTINNLFDSNTIGNFVETNVFGTSFNYNTIGNKNTGNTFPSTSVYNTLQDRAAVNIDFTASSHVAQDYNKTIFRDAGSVAKLSYINNAGVLTVVNANA